MEENIENKNNMEKENLNSQTESQNYNESNSGSGFKEKIKSNPWIISTILLAILSVVLLVFVLTPGLTGNVISEDSAGEKLVDFLNLQTGGGVTLDGIESEGSLYAINVLYQGQEIGPLYMTKDGKYYGQMMLLSELEDYYSNTNTESIEVPKSDKPEVELFIWSYCPYGVQAQGPLSEVAELLKNDADFKVIPYYDGHGEYETQQNMIQGCIQEIAPDKYWQYAATFVEDIYPKCGASGDAECDKTESIKLMKSLGIDSSKVMSCVDEKGEELLDEYSSLASSIGVTSSPTLVVNGVLIQNVARNAEAYKLAVCNAFNDAPETCDEVLNSTVTTSTTAATC